MSSAETFYRDVLAAYNRIVEECFNRCVYTFNYRYLLDDEIDCATHCASKFINSNHRAGMNFGEIQAKKMMDMHELVEQQQQQPPLPMNDQANDNSKSS